MRIRRIVFLGVFLGIFGVVLALETQGPKKRVAIVDFENKTAYGQEKLGRAASDILTTELVKAKRFIVVEREALDKLLAEQKLGFSGVLDETTAAKTGRILGAQAIVTGSISEFGEAKKESKHLFKKKVSLVECAADVRVVDTTTGEIVYADSGVGQVEVESKHFLSGRAGYDETLAGKCLRAALTQVINNVIGQVETLTWQGRVAAIREGMLYINAGEKTGLTKGTVLRVRGKGESIIDPDTGLEIGEAIGPQKAVAEVTEYCGKDCAMAKIKDGGEAQVGDVVTVMEGEKNE
jgi:curli biogenesis system outer membrane secretion channel CsgG